MKRTQSNESSNRRLASYIAQRVLELSGRKSQKEIAREAGFNSPNMMSMLKAGDTKLPLDRVPGLAKALEADPKFLFRLALLQYGEETTAATVQDIFGAVVTDNEAQWLAALREASSDTDPTLTTRRLSALKAMFGR